jgi:hypothetical protein
MTGNMHWITTCAAGDAVKGKPTRQSSEHVVLAPVSTQQLGGSDQYIPRGEHFLLYSVHVYTSIGWNTAQGELVICESPDRPALESAYSRAGDNKFTALGGSPHPYTPNAGETKNMLSVRRRFDEAADAHLAGNILRFTHAAENTTSAAVSTTSRNFLQ